MRTITRHIALAALVLLPLANTASATTCEAQISALASGGAVFSARTDSRAVAVLVFSSSGELLQRLALRRGAVTDLVTFPVLPGAHYDVSFVSKSGIALCIDGIDIPLPPSNPQGGVGGVASGEPDEDAGE